MKTDRADAEQPIERGRQHVLPGVLLHVIEPARPVDLPVGPRRQRRAARSTTCTTSPVVIVDHVDDRLAAEAARVERLSARRRIERRAIEHDVRTPVDDVAGTDDGVERREVASV